MLIKNGLIYSPDFKFHSGCITTNNETIQSLSTDLNPTTDSDSYDATDAYVLPGLTDIHFHGCVGYDFCDGTKEAIHAMASYQLDNINACKTGSTDVDNLAVAYNPQVLVASWVGYDDNRKMETADDKTVAKKTVIDVLNYTNENKDVTWYQPTEDLQQIAINPLTGDFDENGTVYWFKKD